MKRNQLISSTIAAILISIPIIVAKWNTLNASDPTVRPVTEAEVESMIEHNNEEEEPEVVTEIETYIMCGIEEQTKEYTIYNIKLDEEFQKQIADICEKYNMAYELILAVMYTESGYEWKIGDHGQSIGYMQIQPKWWQGLAEANGLDINNPIDNVEVGTMILSKLLNDNAGDLDKALKAYNTGDAEYPGNEYIDKVYGNYEALLNGF